MQKINRKYIYSTVSRALKEDLRPLGDITTKLIKSNKRKIKAKIISKQNGIIAGLGFLQESFSIGRKRNCICF